MSAWLMFRLGKFLALALLVAGVHGAVSASEPAARRRAAFGLATPGFVLTWLLGYALLKASTRSLHEPFVLVSMLASLGALHGALGAATRAAVRPASRVVAVLGLTVSVGAMVVRNGDASAWAAALVGAGLAAALWVRALPSLAAVDVDPGLGRDTLAWFRTIAHLEGGSLLFMLGVAMPIRAATGVALDGGQGHVGWFHGTLVFVYISGLFVARRVLGWSWGQAAVGFVAGLLPFGTFWFVRRVERSTATP